MSFDGQERREGGEYVSRTEFGTRMQKQDILLERLDTAMFAKDAENEFGTPGVMTVMKKLDTHIDVFCSVARTTRKFLKFSFWLIGGFGTVAGAMAAAKAAGWL